MFLLRWYKEYLDIKQEKVCESCETLKMQLSVSNQSNERLMNRLLEKPEPEVKVINTPQETPKPRGPIPWGVKRQMLEAEDREKAKLLRTAAKPIPTEDLEKELDVAGKEREAEAAK